MLFLFLKIFIINLRLQFANSDVIPSLPHCPENNGLGLLIVSTLDGKVSALTLNGSLAWQIETGPGPLLVSNIHKLELTNNAEWVRIIPSLSGTLYRFDGSTIDPIPISAEELLKSSFRYSDDLVVAGGIEVRTYGIGYRTGTIYYECTSQKCSNNDNQNVDDLLLIERNTNIVRAIEPRTGTERWNFSVGLHNVRLHTVSCMDLKSTLYDWNLTTVVPEGKIGVVITFNGEVEQKWQHTLPSPIVRVWKWNGKNLSEVNLFVTKNIPLVSHSDPILPSIYLGMHNRQLYIQESAEMRAILERKPNADIVIESSSVAKIPWKPIPASTQTTEEDSTALSVLNESEYVNGQGFFLYTEDELKKKDNPLCKKNISFVGKLLPGKISISTFESYFILIKDIALSWWRETGILLVTALICHIAFKWIHSASHKLKSDNKSIIPVANEPSSPTEQSSASRRISENSDLNSRYENDFDTLECLGKGGFGVVFSARHKIADLDYAIKRITLPNEQEKKNRMMREVKALAKLEHPNIVRYFNSWVENPPLGWQKEHDLKWLGENSMFDDSETTSEQRYMKSRDLSAYVDREDSLAKDAEEEDSFIVFEHTEGDINSNSTDTEPSKTESRQVDWKRPSRKHHSFDPLEPAVYLYIQMELCKKETLKDWMVKNQDRDFQFVRETFTKILKAVQYIHLSGLIHRDLKPSNIFFSRDGEIKVGDFGLVKNMEETVDLEAIKKGVAPSNNGHTKEVGTTLYMSPELCNSHKYDYKVDIYSLGLIFFELLSPFGTEMERLRTLEDVKKNKYPPNFVKQYSEPHCLLQKMLCVNPNDRLTTIGIIARPPFDAPDPYYGEDYHYRLPSLQN